jgi:anti-sigma factor (TIGR02949 family)
MTCDSVRHMLGAYLDGEIDANAEFQVRAHLAECPDCSVANRRLSSLKDRLRQANLYHSAPPQLEARIQTSLRRATKNERAAHSPRWMAIAASVLLAVLLGWGVYVLRRGTNPELLAQEVVSSHVRSMIGTRLVDVPSSDQHTVKPWFGGKLDYSPPVKDLKDQGFALVGGRIDYMNNRRVAALVYGRRKHVINVFIWPTRKTEATNLETLNGYNVVRWASAGMGFWVISDLNAKELQQLAELLRS